MQIHHSINVYRASFKGKKRSVPSMCFTESKFLPTHLNSVGNLYWDCCGLWSRLLNTIIWEWANSLMFQFGYYSTRAVNERIFNPTSCLPPVDINHSGNRYENKSSGRFLRGGTQQSFMRMLRPTFNPLPFYEPFLTENVPPFHITIKMFHSHIHAKRHFVPFLKLWNEIIDDIMDDIMVEHQ